MKPTTLRVAVLAALALGADAALAQTTVKDAWVRGTVPQQQATGAFMQITSARGGRLLSVASPLAAVVEIHEMAMSGDVMKMHAVPGIDLPAGKAVELKPGGYHVMMLGLKQTLKAGDKVPLTLVIEAKGGKRETLTLNVPVKPLGAP
jgi:copper(I)-binding protein